MTTHAGGENDYDSDNSNNNPASGDLQTWEKVKAKLSEYLSADAFTRWFKNAELIETDGEEGVIGVQSDMQQIWIETNYLDELRAAFAEGAGIHCTPRVTVFGQEVVTQPQKPSKIAARGPGKGSGQVKVVAPDEKNPAFERRLKKMGINPEFDFASFVVGDNSQFAHAACSAVAHREGRSFNPLFIHGRPDLEKPT